MVPLDAEDIAMARLQARLRQAEAMQVPRRPGDAALTRTTVRLPREMLRRVRDRARRDGVTVSEVLEMALGRFLEPS